MIKEADFKLWLMNKMAGAKAILEFLGDQDDPKRPAIEHELAIYRTILHKFMGVLKEDDDTEMLTQTPTRRKRGEK